MTAVMVSDLERLRPSIEEALSYGGNTHRFEDVVEAVEAGRMHAWIGEHSVVVTELVQTPSGRKDLHFFLAAGNEAELKALHPRILEWGQSEGCTHATVIGRKGWARSWLTKDLGWQPTLIVCEREI